MRDAGRATAHIDAFTVLTFVPQSGTGSSVVSVCLNGQSVGLLISWLHNVRRFYLPILPVCTL